MYLWCVGSGDGGLGMGDWVVGMGPNPQSPIPNPQSPIPIKSYFKYTLNVIKKKYLKN